MRRIVFVMIAFLCAFGGCAQNKHISENTEGPKQESFTVSAETSDAREEKSTPEITVPNQGTPLDTMLGAYSFVYTDQSEKYILFFDEKQIQDFRALRENGEQYSLTKEEFNYIVKDTITAFKEYDTIYIRDIDGNLHKYYGLSFYTSQAYKDSFGGFYLGVADASFDYRRDLFDVLFMRLSVFSSAVQAGLEPGGIIFSDTDNLSESELQELASAFETVYVYQSNDAVYVDLLSRFGGAGILFDTRDTFAVYCPDLSEGRDADYQYLFHNEQVDSYISPLIGHYKYDTGSGKAVIVELYEEATQELIARIRLDEENNPSEIKEIERRASFSEDGAPSNGNVITKYRAVIYLNGISILGYPRDSAIKYNPDGDLDRFDVTYGDDVFPRNPLWLKGAKPLTEYITELLEKQLSMQN